MEHFPRSRVRERVHIGSSDKQGAEVKTYKNNDSVDNTNSNGVIGKGSGDYRVCIKSKTHNFQDDNKSKKSDLMRMHWEMIKEMKKKHRASQIRRRRTQ